MAVVSLSRIQIRRGKKNGQPLPQLASGELAWAIDTRELYIGNGTTAEGACEVGNTRILTEHDNAFALTNYTYKDLPVSATRTAQDRLDDYVSLRAFDGVNDTDRLKNAINALFGDTSFLTNAVTLYIEPGTYALDETITLPSNTRIQGSGIGRTIFKITNNDATPAFQTIVENNISPTNVYIDGVTVDISDAKPESDIKETFSLEGLTHSKFSNMEIVGDPFEIEKNRGICFKSFGIGTARLVCQYNIFDNVSFKNCKNAVHTTFDVDNNLWKNCKFEKNQISIFFENSSPVNPMGCMSNTIENCWFSQIDEHAIKIMRGTGNVSKGNRYDEIGNDPITGIPLYSIIVFGSDFIGPGNISEHDWFSRTLHLNNNTTIPYVPEIVGNVVYDNKFRFHKKIIQISDQKFTNFSLYAVNLQTIEVSYQYKNVGSVDGDLFKSGTLTIVANTETGEVSFTDDYNFVGSILKINDVQFNVVGWNYSANTEISIDTLVVTVLDSTNSNTADFYYSVKYLN